MDNFSGSLAVSKRSLVYLVRAESKPSMRMAWYYIQIASKAKLPVFLKKVKTGASLEEFGTILFSGWGTEPPDDIRQKVKTMYGN